MKHQFGFIGCGNMGGALARAAAKSVGGDKILLADKDENKMNALSSEISAAVGDVKDVAANCEYIFLGVKPQVLAAAINEIKPTLISRRDRFVIVSMAAGITTEKLTGWLGDLPIIRIMPNIPASVGEGMILYCTAGGVTEGELDGFLDLMKCAGRLSPLPEKLIDAGSAVSGCGPAYAFMFIEALADGGVECGLPRDKATLLAAQTLIGSAQMVLETGRHPGELKDAVCSPAGSTIVGVHALEKAGFRAAAADAVVESYKKTVDLGKN